MRNMREIKFRGLHNGHWVYGNFIKGMIEGREFYQIEQTHFDDYRQWDIVDPATVGQYIGLKDKNNNEYYFDDIVKGPFGIGVLVWFEDRLGIASGEIGNYHAIDSISKQYLEQYEIIGNIHQHPHLLQ